MRAYRLRWGVLSQQVENKNSITGWIQIISPIHQTPQIPERRPVGGASLPTKLTHFGNTRQSLQVDWHSCTWGDRPPWRAGSKYDKNITHQMIINIINHFSISDFLAKRALFSVWILPPGKDRWRWLATPMYCAITKAPFGSGDCHRSFGAFWSKHFPIAPEYWPPQWKFHRKPSSNLAVPQGIVAYYGLTLLLARSRFKDNGGFYDTSHSKLMWRSSLAQGVGRIETEFP